MASRWNDFDFNEACLKNGTAWARTNDKIYFFVSIFSKSLLLSKYSAHYWTNFYEQYPVDDSWKCVDKVVVDPAFA